MEDSKTLVITALIALSATLTTGALSFFGARLGSKETISAAKRKNRFDGDMKIAEYRLDWIEKLRAEIVELDKIIVTCTMKNIYNMQTEILTQQSSIIYRMNPKDPNYDELVDTIYDMARTQDRKSMIRLRLKFGDMCQRVLKAEWDRLRSEINRAGDHDEPRRLLPASYGKSKLPQ